jgi:hypothetical protein
MPVLNNPHREAFAWMLAEGLGRLDAYRRCGFKAKGKNASDSARRMAARASMAARIDEIRREMDWAASADIPAIINELAWLIRKARGMDTAAALTAAKGMLSEVVKLKGKLADAADAPSPAAATPPEPPMSKADWIEAYVRKK